MICFNLPEMYAVAISLSSNFTLNVTLVELLSLTCDVCYQNECNLNDGDKACAYISSTNMAGCKWCQNMLTIV
ncbi:MAG: hypothetical protein ACTS4W_01455 [Candidatus Hodgkinia cicadicola]